jgi:mannose-6-phosphate isomerase
MSVVQSLLNPLIFEPFYRPQVWGGRGLSACLGRHLPDERPYGEAWEISPQPLHVSKVSEGELAGRTINDLWSNYSQELARARNSGMFPLLIKWLECRELLSLQVHPDDQMAQRVLNEPYGKSEAWIVIAAEPTARVYAGLKPGVSQDDVIGHLKHGTLVECLHSFVPRPGDCVSLPAGTIHAAGGGLVVAEVQQSSDATFRLFDWNRMGLDGKPRPLQIERALEAVNWNQGPIDPVVPAIIESQAGTVARKIVDGNGFRLERYVLNQPTRSVHEGELTQPADAFCARRGIDDLDVIGRSGHVVQSIHRIPRAISQRRHADDSRPGQRYSMGTDH